MSAIAAEHQLTLNSLKEGSPLNEFVATILLRAFSKLPTTEDKDREFDIGKEMEVVWNEIRERLRLEKEAKQQAEEQARREEEERARLELLKSQNNESNIEVEKVQEQVIQQEDNVPAIDPVSQIEETLLVEEKTNDVLEIPKIVLPDPDTTESPVQEQVIDSSKPVNEPITDFPSWFNQQLQEPRGRFIKCRNSLSDTPFSSVSNSSDLRYPHHLPLKLAILGSRMSSSQYLANYLSQKYNLVVIDLETTFNRMMTMYREHRIGNEEVLGIINRVHEGHPLSDDEQRFLIQLILNFSFDFFEHSDLYLDCLLQGKELSSYRSHSSERRVVQIVESEGFILCNVPSTLDQLLNLQSRFSIPTKTSDIDFGQNLEGPITKIYEIDIKDHLQGSKVEEAKTLSLRLFKDLNRDPFFLDAFIILESQSSEILNRGFERCVSSSNQNYLLRNISHEEALILDLPHFRCDSLSSSNNDTLYIDSVNFQNSVQAIVEYLNTHFASDPNICLILKDSSDTDVVMAVDIIDRTLDKILVDKNQKFSDKLLQRVEADQREEQIQRNKYNLAKEALSSSPVDDQLITSVLANAIDCISRSEDIISFRDNYLHLLSFWKTYNDEYLETVNSQLRTHYIDQHIYLNAVVTFKEGMRHHLQSPDHLTQIISEFIHDYNEFTHDFPDILHLDETKAEFHLR